MIITITTIVTIISIVLLVLLVIASVTFIAAIIVIITYYYYRCYYCYYRARVWRVSADDVRLGDFAVDILGWAGASDGSSSCLLGHYYYRIYCFDYYYYYDYCYSCQESSALL